MSALLWAEKWDKKWHAYSPKTGEALCGEKISILAYPVLELDVWMQACPECLWKLLEKEQRDED